MNELRPRSSQKNEQGTHYGAQMSSGVTGNTTAFLGAGGKPPLRDPHHRAFNIPEETVKIMHLDAPNTKGKLQQRNETAAKFIANETKEEFFVNAGLDPQAAVPTIPGHSHQVSGYHQEPSKKQPAAGHSAIPINNFNFFMKNNNPTVGVSKRGEPQPTTDAGIGCLGTATTGKATLSTQQTRGS